MRADGGEEARADAAYPVEAGRPAERPMSLAIRDDPLGERKTYAGESGQLFGASPVGIDALVGPEWS